MNQSPLLLLRDVGKRYGDRDILSSVSLRLQEGEIVFIRGGNGSGKSTLLKLAAGLVPLDSGTRSIQPSKMISYTPDRLPKLKMTSDEYLTHMGRISGMNKQPLQDRIKELHEWFDLPYRSKTHLSHYSKGMLQKTNLMQAILRQPDLLLLDEHFLRTRR
ncbi:ATP-binding cassette domain-containing protein [Paenibacillus herberti]|uniref:ABC transporter domain-containing protein n=1 Tax=Paenibacillus herberti TaxID=1619309 RepID=A0A229NUS8_9BACL|nr:ATP-binding cassette domain-containing protein [Paenibacillus herberti]OXM13580.1 hypothetical protein CGZ75_21340 [Paenibacillus herberti]